MKRTIAAGIITAAVLTAFGAENLIENGGFEKISKKSKGNDKYILEQIKGGWDLGEGPVAILPDGWLINGGKGKLRIITVGENGENKENIHSGNNSAYFEVGGGHIIFSRALPGKYDFSFWYKGTGKITFCAYDWGINPATEKKGHLGTYVFCSVDADNPEEWKQFTQTVTIGVNKGAEGCSIAFAGKGKYFLDDIVMIPAEVNQ